MEYKQHTWRHAPQSTDAFWKCVECNKLDWSAIPDTDPTCSGNIARKIDNEIAANTKTKLAAAEKRIAELEAALDLSEGAMSEFLHSLNSNQTFGEYDRMKIRIVSARDNARALLAQGGN